ncbi:hypothetical protein CLV90_2960 [Maribacter spongiicola]|uniref:PepSY-like beta-lactamase-inhibitor n=2 Tax=Maribacter spongiicola TaxID=1206753 RepID=A0A4R7K090_9FLAO|nr:hypothetical protein CLV90_2960 [Maribacter spongiicola]
MNGELENKPLQNYDRIQEYLIKNNLKLTKTIDANDVEYQIIEVINPANKTFRIWMEIDTSILTKNKIQYQKEID